MTTTIQPPRPTKADRDLAARFGLQAAAIMEMRVSKLEQDTHWKKARGQGAIIFTDDGLAEIERILSLKPAEAVIPVKPDPASIVNLKVLRPCRNPLFCTVMTPDGKAADIRVRRNNRMRHGIILQCAFVDNKWKCVHPGFAPL